MTNHVNELSSEIEQQFTKDFQERFELFAQQLSEELSPSQIAEIENFLVAVRDGLTELVEPSLRVAIAKHEARID